MSTKPMGRKMKAATLVPLALLSAAWTASIANVQSATASGSQAASDLPDGTTVPSQAIKAPASVPVPGTIAPAVPVGSEDAVVSAASTNGIPSAALSAYQRGAQIINAADSTCNIPWELLAAIGRVESNHGQYGGNTLDTDGVSRPGVFGPVLDGKNGTQVIMDTDAGQLDQDAVYDRAVGPMQFIPSTWSAVKVDADGDGQRNPQDVDDASLASAVYLCSGKDDLSARAGQEAAVFRYNHSRAYVDLVLRIMEAYSQGDYTAIPSGTYGGTVFTPSYTSAIKSKKHKAKVRAKTNPTAPAASSPLAPVTTDPGGSTGGSKPVEVPATPVKKDPIKQATETITKAVQTVTEPITKAVEPITTPVVETLDTFSAALGFCMSQLPVLGTIIKTIAPKAGEKCAAKIQGKTEQQAQGILGPLSGITGILKFLGLG